MTPAPVGLQDERLGTSHIRSKEKWGEVIIYRQMISANNRGLRGRPKWDI